MEERIKKVMAAVFGISTAQIGEDTSPDTLENWDSLSHMTLTVALEEEFDVEFDTEEIVGMISYPLIKAAIEKNQQNKKIAFGNNL